jgi:hypothetical protein
MREGEGNEERCTRREGVEGCYEGGRGGRVVRRNELRGARREGEG